MRLAATVSRTLQIMGASPVPVRIGQLVSAHTPTTCQLLSLMPPSGSGLL
jgi:hypothetical protein